MSQTTEPSHESDFIFAEKQPFQLDSGARLSPVTLRYAIYGEPNKRRDNVILCCHALSGSARIADWWPEMFGRGLPFDLDRFCVVGVNILGSCYGSTGPTSINPQTGRAYGASFPVVSIHDMVRAQYELMQHLQLECWHTVIGGSIGGMQALAWATLYPHRVARCVSIGAVPLSAMGLALNHLQRQAIYADAGWCNGDYPLDQQPARGLALARGIAMCSYKSAELFQTRYGRRPNQRQGEDPTTTLEGRYDVGGYLDYQGKIFVDRFDANSYLVITKAMDNFSLGVSQPGTADGVPEKVLARDEVLRRIRAITLLVGIPSDWLFPAAEVRALAEEMQTLGLDAHYFELTSPHGHDAFLAHVDELTPLLAPLFDEQPTPSTATGIR